MLHYTTIDPSTLELLKKLQKLSCLADTRLVGGTAYALQKGHRKSIDIDLFGSVDVTPEELQEELKNIGSLQILKNSKHIHVYALNGVKVDIVNYSYPWLEPAVIEDGLRLAHVKDICAMKLAAITGRGSKKDFVDLYFLLQSFELAEIFDLYSQKYKDGSVFLAMKSLSYFDDAEKDPDPEMLIPVTWKSIKDSISSLF